MDEFPDIFDFLKVILCLSCVLSTVTGDSQIGPSLVNNPDEWKLPNPSFRFSFESYEQYLTKCLLFGRVTKSIFYGLLHFPQDVLPSVSTSNRKMSFPSRAKNLLYSLRIFCRLVYLFFDHLLEFVK